MFTLQVYRQFFNLFLSLRLELVLNKRERLQNSIHVNKEMYVLSYVSSTLLIVYHWMTFQTISKSDRRWENMGVAHKNIKVAHPRSKVTR